MQFLFPRDYPFSPVCILFFVLNRKQSSRLLLQPFVRVIRPRFKFLTGHITIGGSICTQVSEIFPMFKEHVNLFGVKFQLLTLSGWVSTASLENIIVQLRAEIVADPKAEFE